MKILSFIKKSIPIIIAFSLGLSLGVWKSDWFRDKFGLGDIKYNPIEPSPQLSNVAIAHSYSVAFRQRSLYCSGPINPANEGFLELTYDNIIDLKNAAIGIRSNVDPTLYSKPNKFRLIYGDNNTFTYLMVVGLNNVAPYQEIHNGPLGHSLIYKLENAIPCPRQCDASRSGIILGSTQDACR